MLQGPQRSAANRARDTYRHPVETLTLLRPEADDDGRRDHAVGRLVTPRSSRRSCATAAIYITAGSFPGTEGGAKAVAKFQAKLDADPGSYAKVTVTSFAKDHYDIAPPGSADMVLTFRNVHNFTTGGYGPAAFAAFYAALKPGGVLGIEEHRLPEDRPDALQDSSGYMKVSTVRHLAEAAGFRFVAASEVNGQPEGQPRLPQGVCGRCRRPIRRATSTARATRQSARATG